MQTERKREGADLDDFLELLRTDVNPEGVPGVPHMDGWVPPTAALWSRMQDGRARAPHPRIKGPSCGACASCRQPWLHQVRHGGTGEAQRVESWLMTVLVLMPVPQTYHLLKLYH